MLFSCLVTVIANLPVLCSYSGYLQSFHIQKNASILLFFIFQRQFFACLSCCTRVRQFSELPHMVQMEFFVVPEYWDLEMWPVSFISIPQSVFHGILFAWLCIPVFFGILFAWLCIPVFFGILFAWLCIPVFRGILFAWL